MHFGLPFRNYKPEEGWTFVRAADLTGDGRADLVYSPELSLIAETELTSSSTRPAIAYEYVWFGSEPLVQYAETPATAHYYFNDHLGAPLLTTSSAAPAVVDWRVEREPYGKIYATRVSTSRRQPLTFPGQEEDAGSDRLFNAARWYRPGWGRYTQADPLDTRVEGVNNGFRYALSSPLRWIDPSGLESTHASDIRNCLVNPIDCARVVRCREEATAAARRRFDYASDGAPQNAYLHCYWNCCMAKIIGPEEAKKFGDAHENYSGNPSCSRSMDLHNNEQGRRVSGDTSCDSHCSTVPLQHGAPAGHASEWTSGVTSCSAAADEEWYLEP